MTAWILAIGRMLGLGSFAGIRPSLTLAVIGVVGYFDWGVETNSTFSWLNHWLAIGIFVVLAILESTFDKISKLDRLQDRLIMPYRLIMGGVAGAATIPFGWKGIVIGAAVGAGAAWFAQYTKHLSRPKSVPSEAVMALISAARTSARSSGASSSSRCRTSATPAWASPGSCTGGCATGGAPSTSRCAAPRGAGAEDGRVGRVGGPPEEAARRRGAGRNDARRAGRPAHRSSSPK